MFDNLRRAFREAADNFHRELDRDAVPEAVDRLLRGMQREVDEAERALETLKVQLAGARKRSDEEARNAETCERRERLAREIGDEDTAGIAARYAERHAARSVVLADRARTIEAEIRLQEAECAEMREQVEKARANRDRLGASAAGNRTGEPIGGTDDPFGEPDRTATGTGDDRSSGRGPEPLFVDTDDFDGSFRASHRERVADARLEELKRRMGRR